MTLLRRFQFLHAGEACPPGAVGVDSALSGVALDLSHWKASRVPDSVRGDTGCELVIAALDQPELWQGITWVVNDHCDADGLLAAILACRGEPVRDPQQRAILLGAAAAADFSEWHGPAAMRLVLQLHRLIAATQQAWETAQTTEVSQSHAESESEWDCWESLCYHRAITEWPQIWQAAQEPDDEIDASVEYIEAVIDRLKQQDGFTIQDHGVMWSIAWRSDLGHQHNGYNLVDYRGDDCPLPALAAVIPEIDTNCVCGRFTLRNVIIFSMPHATAGPTLWTDQTDHGLMQRHWHNSSVNKMRYCG